MVLSWVKLVIMILLHFLGRNSHFKFCIFKKVTIFLKFLNYRIITAKTTFFENTQYSQIYIHYGPVAGKSSYNDFTLFFG